MDIKSLFPRMPVGSPQNHDGADVSSVAGSELFWGQAEDKHILVQVWLVDDA